jgi:hypothetical protein
MKFGGLIISWPVMPNWNEFANSSTNAVTIIYKSYILYIHTHQGTVNGNDTVEFT